MPALYHLGGGSRHFEVLVPFYLATWHYIIQEPDLYVQGVFKHECVKSIKYVSGQNAVISQLVKATYVLVFQTPIDVPAGEHKLQYAYCLWYSRRSPGKQASVQNYDQNLKLIGRFASVEQFWALYSHLVRPSDLQSHSDFHLFKVGIKPMWEVSVLITFSPLLFLKEVK
jgi:hypothetical protein